MRIEELEKELQTWKDKCQEIQFQLKLKRLASSVDGGGDAARGAKTGMSASAESNNVLFPPDPPLFEKDVVNERETRDSDGRSVASLVDNTGVTGGHGEGPVLGKHPTDNENSNAYEIAESLRLPQSSLPQSSLPLPFPSNDQPRIRDT